MFDISMGELILLVTAAVLFLKPQDVPKIVRTITKATRWIKRTSRDVTSLFEDFIDEKPSTRFIKGEDGKFYEAYDITSITSSTEEKKP